VGNTEARPPDAANIAVHPHACGEYVPQRADVRFGIGSPPRVWGIL